MSLFDEVNFAEITHPDYPGERLVACRNPALAKERARRREELLVATETRLAEVKAAVEREKRPYRGKDKIALRVGKVINRYKVGKHFELVIGEDSFNFSRKDDQVSAEAALDGIYVVRASAPHTEGLSAAELVGAYKDLKFNEAGFRSLKAIDLDLRPICHYSEGRVRAHVLICMLALYLIWHLRRAWAPLCFTDEAPLSRTDPVAPALRSPEALSKVSRKRSLDGQPLHSFATLLDELASLTRNTVVFTGGGQGDQALHPDPPPTACLRTARQPYTDGAQADVVRTPSPQEA